VERARRRRTLQNHDGGDLMRTVILRAILASLLTILQMQAVAETIRVEVPLMGRGDLAILSVTDKQVHLANLKTSSQREGTVYFDEHVRMTDVRISGDPPQIEFVMRIRLDCNEMRFAVLSSLAQNFHTGVQAEKAFDFADNPTFNPLRAGTGGHDICVAINGGENLFAALAQNHYDLLGTLPRYALSYQDAFDITETDEFGKLTQAEESSLLQYLRENNPNF
jgi:hypothetical protein